MKRVIALVTIVGLIVIGLVGYNMTTWSSDHAPTPGNVEIFELRIESDNAWLLVDGDDASNAILIDASRPANAVELDQQIRDAGVNPAELDALIITHGHFDHAGGAAHFRQAYGTKIIVGAGDRAMIESGLGDDVCPTFALARYMAGPAPEDGQWGTPADIVVEDRLDLSAVSTIEGEVVVLPGHTPGSLIVKVDDSVFVGDLVRGKAFGSGPARHLFMCDIADNDADIRFLLETIAPNAQRFFPGHLRSFSREQLERFVRD